MYERNVGIINLEAASKRSAKAPQSRGPKNLSMAWDDTSLGLGSVVTRDGLLDDRQKKDIYYQVYLGDQWVSGCVDRIAARMTSGGWESVEVEKGKGSEKNAGRIKDLLSFESLEEDFLQFLRSIVTDELIFGEAFCELGYLGDEVVALYPIDSLTMTPYFDKHGTVTGYTQRLEKSTDIVRFEPREIVRWWLPDPKAKKKALSPIERLRDPVFLDRSMVTWGEKFFRQGGKPSYWVGMGDDSNEADASRYIKWYKENYTGMENAHIPPVMYGGSKINEYGKGSIELDFDKSQNKQRDRVLVVYGVPPAQLNIIESGNLGGGTGDSQEKSFDYNTVAPHKRTILEKFNYRAIKVGKGIEDWIIDVHTADYRDDNEIADVEDKGIRNGSLTINEAREGRGRLAVKGGDTNAIITGNIITPVSRLETMEEEQTQQAQLSLQGAQQAMQRMQQGDNQDNPDDNQDGNQPPKDKQPPKQKDEKPKG
jgi:HK97 family phage portal protein